MPAYNVYTVLSRVSIEKGLHMSPCSGPTTFGYLVVNGLSIERPSSTFAHQPNLCFHCHHSQSRPRSIPLPAVLSHPVPLLSWPPLLSLFKFLGNPSPVVFLCPLLGSPSHGFLSHLILCFFPGSFSLVASFCCLLLVSRLLPLVSPHIAFCILLLA